MKYWTSGADDRCDAQTSVFSWCALNTVVTTGLLTDYMKATTSMTEPCLLFDPAGKDNSSILAHSDCANKMPYICEGNCTKPTCPSYCVKNVQVKILKTFYVIFTDNNMQATLFNEKGKVASKNI